MKTTITISRNIKQKIEFVKNMYGCKNIEEALEIILDKVLSGKTIELAEIIKNEYERVYDRIFELLESMKKFTDIIYNTVMNKGNAVKDEIERKEAQIAQLRKKISELEEKLEKYKKFENAETYEFVVCTCEKEPFKTYFILIGKNGMRIFKPDITPFERCNHCENFFKCMRKKSIEKLYKIE